MNGWGLPIRTIRPLTVVERDVRSVVYPNLALDSVSGVIAQIFSATGTDRLLFRLQFNLKRPGVVSLWRSDDPLLWTVTPHSDGYADELALYLLVLEHTVHTQRRSTSHQALRVFKAGVFELIDIKAPRLDRIPIRVPPGAWILMPEGSEDA